MKIVPSRSPTSRPGRTQGRKISVLTAYDYPLARLFDAAGVDCLLVGDSMGTTVQGKGHDAGSHSRADALPRGDGGPSGPQGARGGRHAVPVVSGFATPGHSLQWHDLKQTNCKAVKLEGGQRMAATIKAVVEAEIPVMAHIGLTPQSIRRLGSYKVQRAEDVLQADAQAVAEAGAFAVVLECVPAEIASSITAKLSIPTIGIGAGNGCDGQVLVMHDMLGLLEGSRPRFARLYADLGEAIKAAATNYVRDVRSGAFPASSESFR